MRLCGHLILLSLLCNFQLVLSFDGMFREYTRKWPHCTNIVCFNNKKLTLVKEWCMASPECNGVSFSTGRSTGSGCLKKNCWPDYVKGYGFRTHDYYRKYMFRVYTRKWPHCTNIRCFSNNNLKDVQQWCMATSACDGVSFSTGRSKGSGCLKKDCQPDNVNGYGFSTHDYYRKDPKDTQNKYRRKYRNKWPHCTNLGACFNNIPLSYAQNVCATKRGCDGFSFSNRGTGKGCFKTNCGVDSVKGYGYGSYDYYEKLF